MRNILITLIFIICVAINLIAQPPQYSYFGKHTTPQDSLRGLVIFVGFGSEADNVRVSGWNDVFPDWVKDKKAYYSDISDFDMPISSNDSFNISRWYYEMSKNSPRPFKLIANTNYVTKKLYFCNSNFDFFINYIRVQQC